MSPTLREPFFPRGRKSVLQRAILMSLVLAGLSSAAAWIIVGTFYAIFRHSAFLRRVLGDWSVLAFPLSFMAFAILVTGPLNHWRNREWPWTGVAVPLSLPLGIPSAIILFGREMPLLVEKTPPLEFLTIATTLVAVAVLQSLPLLQRTRNDLLIVCASMLGSILMALIVFELTRSGLLARFDIRVGFHAALLKAGLISLWFAALSIPWGVAFWPPPVAPDLLGHISATASHDPLEP